MTKKEKQAAIAAAAAELEQEVGTLNINRELLCDRAKVPSGSFYYVTGMTFTEYMAGRPFVKGDVTKKHIPKDRRRELILMAAVNVAREVGYSAMSRGQVAEEANISEGLVTNHFNTMKQLRRAVMRYAVANEVLEVVGQGLAVKDPQALKAPDDLRERAISAVLE